MKKSITEEEIIKKFQKSNLSAYPDVHEYTKKAEPILWLLWIIKEKFKIEAYIPAGTLANIMVDGIGKSSDEKSIKNALAHYIGTKVHRKIVDGQHSYKIMQEGVKHLGHVEEKNRKGKNEKIYKSGQQYNIYKDLKNLVIKAKKEVFIIDAYPDPSLFDLYVDVIPQKVSIKILTKNPPNNFKIIATMVAEQRKLSVVDSPHVHDRYIIIDNECWMIGSSIKDAAKKKPTTLVKIEGVKTIAKIYEAYFKSGTKLT